MAAQYDDEKAIYDFYLAVRNKKSLDKKKKLAKLIQNPGREVFNCECLPPVHMAAKFNDVPTIKMLISKLNFKMR